MGSGAPRTLGNEDGPKKDIDPDDSQRLEAALKTFEQKDAAFKQSREDEVHQQVSKAWVNKCNEIVNDLRRIGKAIVNQHQVLTDCGQEGAGHGASPWVEEAGLKFDKLQFRLKGTSVIAEVGMTSIAECEHFENVTYEWLEKAMVSWMIHEATKG